MRNIEFNEPKGQAWVKAKSEKNWLLFGIFEADDTGKSQKRPIKSSNKAINLGIHDAAQLTFDTAMEQIQYQRERGFTKINKARKDYADSKGKGHIEMVDVALGYCPRPGSAMIVVDLDDCFDVKTGKVSKEWVELALMMLEGGYVEASTSGTGLRMLMPRVEGDDSRFRSNGEYGGAGIFGGGGKGCVIMGQAYDGRIEVTREDATLDVIEEHIHAIRKTARERVFSGSGGGSLQDSILNFGFTDLDTFKEMAALAQNGPDIGSEWYGLVMAAREHFALQEIDGTQEDELFEAINEWSSRWEGGDHDPDKLIDVFNRPISLDSSGGTGMGTWYHLAKEGGWDGPSAHRDEQQTNREEKSAAPPLDSSGGDVSQEVAAFDVPTGKIDNLDKFRRRFVLANGLWFDLLQMRERSETEIGNETMRIKMEDVLPNGKMAKVKPNMASRMYWCKRHADMFDGVTWFPGAPMLIQDQMPVEGHLVRRVGQKWINTWEPMELPEGYRTRGTGTADIWIEHVRRIYPDDADQIFDWLALCLQKQGQKVGFGLVLGGTPGSGKDTLLMPVINALGRSANGQVSFTQVAGEFDDWIFRKTFVVVQEANSFGSRNAGAIVARLRSFIALGGPLLVNPKGSKSKHIPNVANIVITVNELDALRIPPDDRRYFICWTDEDPMTSEQKDRLFGWYENGGMHEVARWLMDRQVQMRTGDAPPMTGGRFEMVKATMPDVLETIAGVAHDRWWLSTSELTALVGLEYDGRMRKMGTDIATCLKFLGMHKRKAPQNTNWAWMPAVDPRGRIKVKGVYHMVWSTKSDMNEADWKEVVRGLNEEGVAGMN